jgi:hypothetical protein
MPEAYAVHMLDNLDGKLWSAWKAQDDRGGDASWSPMNRHLGRRIYRGPISEEKREREIEHGGPAEPTPAPAPVATGNGPSNDGPSLF